MIATRLMLVELVRVVSEMLIHLILFDYDPSNIHLDAQVHSLAGENRLLYDAAVEMGWESRSLEDVAWACSARIYLCPER
jgi:hypothetical protein